MECPRCSSETRVTDSRTEHQHGLAVRRRRTCMSCHHRFTTYEIELRQDQAVTIARPGREGMTMTHFTRVDPKQLWAEVANELPSGTVDEVAGE